MATVPPTPLPATESLAYVPPSFLLSSASLLFSCRSEFVLVDVHVCGYTVGHKNVPVFIDHPRSSEVYNQWQRQRSIGARSFRGQKILQPGHPDALFFSRKVDDLFQLSLSKRRPPTPFHRQNKTSKAVRYDNILCSHYYRSKAIRMARQGGVRAVDLPARSFDLALRSLVYRAATVYNVGRVCLSVCLSVKR